MHAITFAHPGEPNVLTWNEATVGPAGAADVVIDVAAAGVNNADLLQRRGLYPVPAGASPILGLEASGTVVKVGADANGVAVGDRVCALLTGGGYAEQVIVNSDMVFPVPENLNMAQAAALPEAACTVYSNVGMLGNLQPNETLLIHGGGSGIGTFAIQWAKALGARVLVTAGSPNKCERCLELGADVAINYRTEDFVAKVAQATDGHGADVILDLVGNDYLVRNIETLATDGRLIIIGNASTGPSQPIDLGMLMAKRAYIAATTLRSRPNKQKADIVRQVLQNVWPMIEHRQIKPVVDTELPMPRAAAAHELLASGGLFGKVVLTVPR